MSSNLLQPYIKGFLSTQSLNLSDRFPSIFHLTKVEDLKSELSLSTQQRLGHFAEELFVRLVREQLARNELLLTNLQIINHKITLGELDVIIVGERLTHIEFCYKIYLYDPNLSEDEFNCWIGPNRRDSLAQKVEKLNTKQLPLLFNEHTASLLQAAIKNYDQLTKHQEVAFMAQLYVPYSNFISKTNYQYGHPDGFYIHFSELDQFPDAEWHVPDSKLDWILLPHSKIAWMDQHALKITLSRHSNRDSNPLCWMKTPSGELHKCFVVNWLI